MIAAERRDGRFYCARQGCGRVLDGIWDRPGTTLSFSGWWDVIHTGPDQRLLRWNDHASSRRRAKYPRPHGDQGLVRRYAEQAPSLYSADNPAPLPEHVRGSVKVMVPLPIMVECPHCRTPLRIEVASSNRVGSRVRV